MDEIYEEDFNNCEYSNCSYFESDTGYREYKCELTGYECMGGSFESGCLLSFKYDVK